MNGLATAGIVGGAIGLAKGIADQHNAKRYDPYASREIQHYAANGLRSAGTASLMAMGGYAGIQALRGKGFKIKGHTIDDIAASIAKNDYVQAVFPGVAPLKQEINERIGSYVDDGSYIKILKDKGLGVSSTKKDAKIIQTFADNFDPDNLADIGLSADVISKITAYNDTVTSKNVQDALSSIKKDANSEHISKLIDEHITPQIMHKTGFEDASARIHGVNYALNVPRAYYGNPDKKIRNTRIATTAGAYVGAAVGGRYLAGGTLTTDSYGRKDIVVYHLYRVINNE